MAAHLLGAEEAMRERTAMPNPFREDELAEAWGLVRDVISAEDWEHHRQLGRQETLEELLVQLQGRTRRTALNEPAGRPT